MQHLVYQRLFTLPSPGANCAVCPQLGLNETRQPTVAECCKGVAIVGVLDT